MEHKKTTVSGTYFRYSTCFTTEQSTVKAPLFYHPGCTYTFEGLIQFSEDGGWGVWVEVCCGRPSNLSPLRQKNRSFRDLFTGFVRIFGCKKDFFKSFSKTIIFFFQTRG